MGAGGLVRWWGQQRCGPRQPHRAPRRSSDLLASPLPWPHTASPHTPTPYHHTTLTPASPHRAGLARCPDSIPLWRSAARLEEEAGNVARARALLEQARLKNPKSAELWLAAIRTEQRAGNEKAADTALAKALQVCVCGAWGLGRGCG